MTDFPTFKVELDPQVEREAPPTENHRIQWAYLDTALKVLREGAARSVLQAVREGADGDFPSDTEILQKMAEACAAGEQDAPHGLWDMAPFDQMVLMSLSGILQQMMDDCLGAWEDAVATRARFEEQLTEILGLPETD